MGDRDVALLFGTARAIAGAFLFLAPRRGSRMWTGRSPDDVAGTLALRGFGARDLSLGLGLALAIGRGTSVRGWLEGGAIADSADAIGTRSAWNEMSKPRALFWLASQTGCAYLGMRLADSLD